ncbi:MAG: hypothetical protein WD825_06395 [Gemmatimonadaceae bacterium]
MRASLEVSMCRVGLVAALVSGSISSALAQLPNASAAAHGMGGNFTAIAKGYEAVAWNPANLAMPGRPFLSLGLGIFGGNAGLEPIDVTALNAFSGKVVDSVTRVAWIDQVRLAGKQRGKVDAGVTPIALSLGPFGLQVGTSFYSNVDLSPDAFEAIMFGNAGNNSSQPKTLDFTGTSIRSGAISAGGLSFATPLPVKLTGGFLSNERAAIGITGKYVVGHALVLADDIGSVLGTDDIQLRFPVITVRTDDALVLSPDDEYKGVAGTGVGADVSLAWSGGPWKIGVLAENVFNSFKWDTTKLAYLPGTGTFQQGSNSTDFDEQPYGNAPQALRDLVAAQQFKPALAIGAAFRPMSSLTLTADMKTYTGGDEAIIFGPRSHFGVGAEWRILPFIPLRGGIASITDGWQAGAGAGFRLLGYELGVSTSIRRRGPATESGVMIGVVGIGR